MKAAYIEAPGPAENIIVGELPDPVPGPGEVLVRVGAAALNPIDTYIRAGIVKTELPTPFVVGADLAGTVEAVGAGVTRFQPGDRVWGSNQGSAGRQGTFAELAAVGEQWLHPTPENVTDEDAAAQALVGITAYLGLIHHGQARAGETVFVSGGTGGVGSIVVQMARIVGTRIVTTAGSAAKAQLARELGADRVVEYKQEDVGEAIRDFAPQGVDVWYETLATPNFETTLPLLARGGRMILMAGRQSVAPLPIGPLYTMDRKLLGFAMFNSPAEEQRAIAQQINAWLAAGQLRANIGRIFPLEHAAQAHRLQEENTLHKAGTLTGKIVIKP